MDTKLTLKLDSEVIEMAKIYAAGQKRSLSKIIENYLKIIAKPEKTVEEDDIFKVSPYIKSLTRHMNIPSDYDYKKDYADYLAKKYS